MSVITANASGFPIFTSTDCIHRTCMLPAAKAVSAKGLARTSNTPHSPMINSGQFPRIKALKFVPVPFVKSAGT